MPIAFSCSCGRKINAKDELAGKKAKCPACGQVVTIPHPATKSMAAAGAKPAAAKPTAAAAAPRAKAAAPPPAPAPAEDDGMYDMKDDAPPAKKPSRPAADAPESPWGDDDPGLDVPVVAPRPYVPGAGVPPAAGAPRGKGAPAAAAAAAAPAGAGAGLGSFAALGSKRASAAPAQGGKVASGFHLSGFAKFMIGTAILLPTTFFVIKQGPVKAVAEWEKAEEYGENDVHTLVARTIHEMDAATMAPPDPDEEPSGIPYHPQVTNFYFLDAPMIMWRMPDSIEFQGSTSFGPYKGVYWTRKREMTGEMEWKGDDMLKLEGKCDEKGQIVSLLIDGIPYTDTMALSKKFDGYLFRSAAGAAPPRRMSPVTPPPNSGAK